jgi:hypothetical protein
MYLPRELHVHIYEWVLYMWCYEHTRDHVPWMLFISWAIIRRGAHHCSSFGIYYYYLSIINREMTSYISIMYVFHFIWYIIGWQCMIAWYLGNHIHEYKTYTINCLYIQSIHSIYFGRVPYFHSLKNKRKQREEKMYKFGWMSVQLHQTNEI